MPVTTIHLEDAGCVANGITDNSGTLGTLNAGDYATGGSGSYKVANDATIPASVSLRMFRGQLFDVGAGKTLTISGQFEAGPYQVFSAASAVAFGTGTVDSVDPRWWGAAVDGSANDTPEFQSSENASQGVVRVPPGTSRLESSSTAAYTFGNDPALDVHRAVRVQRSNSIYEGDGVVQPYGYAGATGSIVMPAFATDKNLTLGTLRNLTFRNFRIEASGTGSPGVNRRGFYLMGIMGLRMLDLTVQNSSGSRDLYLGHLQNNQDLLICGLRLKDTTAGFNFRYCRGVVLSDVEYDNFSEAFDFDGVNWDVAASNLVFRNGGPTNQCIDMNSLVNALFEGITVRNVGNICTIQYKHTTPPTFADYVANEPVTVMTPSERVTVRGVKGEQVGGAYGVSSVMPSALIGNDWSGLPHAGFGPVEDIRLIDWDLKTCGFISVQEGRRILLEDVRLETVASPSGAYAIDARSQYGTSDKDTWSDLDLTLRNVAVSDTDRGGVRIAAPSRLVIDGLRTRGCDTLSAGEFDLRIQYLEARGAQVDLDGLDIEADMIIGGSSPTGAEYRVRWSGNNRVGGALYVTGDAHEKIDGRTIQVPIGDVAATGSSTHLLFSALRRCRIARVYMTARTAVNAGIPNPAPPAYTDYKSFNFKRQSGGSATSIATPNTIAGWSAFVPVSAGFTAEETAADLAVGDAFTIDISSVGSRSISGLTVTFELIEY
jgi:hypothetical protein